MEYIERAGYEDVYLLDNASTYPPLLEYYEKTPHRVIRFEHNLGHLVFWRSGLMEQEKVTGKFVVTDSDVVPIEECPLDAVEYFSEVLDYYPPQDCFKAGFGLKLDDIPDHFRFKDEVIAWESRFWQMPIGPRLYQATLGTQFALYRPQSDFARVPTVRTGFPYMARHTSWYIDSANLDEEQRFYRDSVPAENRQWEADTLPWRIQEWLEQSQKK
jgi:hypothetical protein